MQTLSIREMRNQLGKLDTLIIKEHELIITRHNKPVARILPIKGEKPRPSHKALRASLPFQDLSSENLQRIDRDER
jgi:antitoxin (DNA-binding transcriptional repressor) of toxin-antitoxin stability system